MISSPTRTGLKSSLGMFRAVCSRSDSPRRARTCLSSISTPPPMMNSITVSAAAAKMNLKRPIQSSSIFGNLHELGSALSHRPAAASRSRG